MGIHLLRLRDTRGRLSGNQATARADWPGAARSGDGRRGYGILRFAAVEPQEAAAGLGPHRHLRQDGAISEALERGALETRGPPAQRGMEEASGRGAQAPVEGRARAHSEEVLGRQAQGDWRDFCAAAVWRV